MKKIRILFQGDSVTDGSRDESDYHNLGSGYPKYAAEKISAKYPDTEFEFINLGRGGTQTKELAEVLQECFIDIQPDIVSILIGINDVWWGAAHDKNWIPNEVFEQRYRIVLDGLKEKTHAKIMIMEPFILHEPLIFHFREDLDRKIDIVRKLALEYADAFVPTDGLLYAASLGKANPLDLGTDGIHPTAEGAECIGKIYCDYVSPLIDSLLK